MTKTNSPEKDLEEILGSIKVVDTPDTLGPKVKSKRKTLFYTGAAILLTGLSLGTYFSPLILNTKEKMNVESIETTLNTSTYEDESIILSKTDVSNLPKGIKKIETKNSSYETDKKLWGGSNVIAVSYPNIKTNTEGYEKLIREEDMVMGYISPQKDSTSQSNESDDVSQLKKEFLSSVRAYEFASNSLNYRTANYICNELMQQHESIIDILSQEGLNQFATKYDKSVLDCKKLLHNN